MKEILRDGVLVLGHTIYDNETKSSRTTFENLTLLLPVADVPRMRIGFLARFMFDRAVSI